MNDIRLTPEQCMLLVVDVQERLVPAIQSTTAAQLLHNTVLLVRAAKLFHVPIIVSEQYPKGLGPTISELADQLDGCDPIEKTTFSCLKDPSLNSAITALERKQVVLCGVETHVCVLQTALDLLDDGHTVHVVSDAVGSRTEENRLIGLDLIRTAGGLISSVETVAFQWAHRAGNDAFKELSRLVR
jgi:nicotinamidase-related amidase